MNIKLYNRADWNQIKAVGAIANIIAVDKHYVTVEYSSMSAAGFKWVESIKDTSRGKVNGNTLIGFSINWKDTPSDILNLCENVYRLETIGASDLRVFNDVMNIVKRGKLYLHNLDIPRGSVLYHDGITQILFISENIEYDVIVTRLLELDRIHIQRMNTQRTIWYKWLKEAEYVTLSTGSVFKFLNNLTVKMDDSVVDSFNEDGDYLFCETRDHEGVTDRFETEYDFLAWLTRYF